MDKQDKQEMKQIIFDKIEETKEEIEELKELTKPVEPDNAIGRLSRMDAINNKTINEAALRKQKSKLQKLERALEKIEDDKYGICVGCGEKIPLGRLKFMPWTSKCVTCA